jgi:hypothetical protein
MFRRGSALMLLVFVVGLALASVSDAALVGWWKFNDGSGTVAKDSSGRGNHGTIVNPDWVAGKFGGALNFTGTNYVDVPADSWSTIKSQATVCFWAYGDPAAQPQANFIFGAFSDPANNEARKMSAHVPWSDGTIYFDTGGPGYNRINKAGSASDYKGTWTFWTFLKNADTGDQQIYINGVLWHSGTAMKQTMEGVTKFTIGTKPSLAEGWYRGMIDDFRLYDAALTLEEIQAAMAGKGPSMGQAEDPTPKSETIDVPQDAVLSWAAGQYAATHNVYFGTNFEDVNEATVADPRGVLVSEGQTDASYDPEGLLEFGQTYYWRIDEVNAAPDHTVYKGQTWTFTAEPYSYPLTAAQITATASNFQAGMGPENTINGSGLVDGQHSVALPDMWMTTGGLPAWVQYEFDKVYKLDKMLVWNSNQAIESFLGFGAKGVAVEYSLDGQTWTAVEGVAEFAKATGAPTYTANTTVEFGDAMAKFVKITINGNWGGMAQQTGLAEVRFYYAPVQAFQPQPADAATGVSVVTDLAWRPGRGATSHTVYVGADSDAVANGTVAGASVAAHGYTPTGLLYDTQYFWKVDEVGADGTQAGDVWTFTTEEFGVIDDFEGYNDDDNRIYQSWEDGLTTQASGSQVGYDSSPFAEKTIVHGGKQAMPLIYSNASFAFSEATRTFSPAQDWTARGIKCLVIHFRGQADNGGQLYVKIGSKKIAYDGPAANIARPSWQMWSIDLATAGSISSVKSLTIGIEGAGKSGKLIIDDIRLYPEVLDDTNPDVTGAGDTVRGVPNDNDWPTAEYPDLAIDDNVSTKFLHRKGGAQATGIQIQPLVGSTIVTGLTFTSANDTPTRDPIKYTLSGSNASIDGPYTQIAAGDIVDFAGAAEWPRLTKTTTPIAFANTTAYKYYQIVFPKLRGATETLMQIAEIEFLGTVAP